MPVLPISCLIRVRFENTWRKHPLSWLWRTPASAAVLYDRACETIECFGIYFNFENYRFLLSPIWSQASQLQLEWNACLVQFIPRLSGILTVLYSTVYSTVLCRARIQSLNPISKHCSDWRLTGW